MRPSTKAETRCASPPDKRADDFWFSLLLILITLATGHQNVSLWLYCPAYFQSPILWLFFLVLLFLGWGVATKDDRGRPRSMPFLVLVVSVTAAFLLTICHRAVPLSESEVVLQNRVTKTTAGRRVARTYHFVVLYSGGHEVVLPVKALPKAQEGSVGVLKRRQLLFNEPHEVVFDGETVRNKLR